MERWREREREREGQTDRHTEIQTDRKIDRQKDRERRNGGWGWDDKHGRNHCSLCPAGKFFVTRSVKGCPTVSSLSKHCHRGSANNN